MFFEIRIISIRLFDTILKKSHFLVLLESSISSPIILLRSMAVAILTYVRLLWISYLFIQAPFPCWRDHCRKRLADRAKASSTWRLRNVHWMSFHASTYSLARRIFAGAPCTRSSSPLRKQQRWCFVVHTKYFGIVCCLLLCLMLYGVFSPKTMGASSEFNVSLRVLT